MKWLLIDSSGMEASLAVGEGPQVLAVETVPGRSFSAAWPGVLRGMLGLDVSGAAALDAVGVVAGPGSFTGVRVGLAVAKGLCEAWGIPLVALSRLEVLQRLGVDGVVAVLDAGRGEFYVRDGASERLLSREQLWAAVQERDVVAAEQKVVDVLAGAGRTELVALDAATGVGLLLERVEAEDFSDLSSLDANYVRGESEMYAGKGAGVRDAAAK